MASTSLTSCALCQAKASQLCAACRNVVYCSREHQKEHWKKGHRSECQCFEIATNEVLGRHLRATRDIKIGEQILKEAPLVLGPKVASAPLCLGCHRNLWLPRNPAVTTTNAAPAVGLCVGKSARTLSITRLSAS